MRRTALASSGGSTVGEALNILAGYSLSQESRTLPLHHYLESLRYALEPRRRGGGSALVVHPCDQVSGNAAC